MPVTTVNEVNELFVPQYELENYLAEAKSLPSLNISKVRSLKVLMLCTFFNACLQSIQMATK